MTDVMWFVFPLMAGLGLLNDFANWPMHSYLKARRCSIGISVTSIVAGYLAVSCFNGTFIMPWPGTYRYGHI